MALFAKVVVLGDGAIGKTTLIKRLIDGVFIDSTLMTIGVAFHTYIGKTVDGKDVNMQIWDLGGQEQFRSMGVFDRYLKGSKGILVGVDLTDIETLENVNEWIELVRNNVNAPIVLFGTKADLADKIEITEEMLTDATTQFQLNAWLTTSAKDNINTETLFQMLIGYMFA